MDRDRILLTPGPLTTTLRTKLAMLKDWGSWDTDFIAVTASVRRRLLDIVHGADTHVLVPLQGSGTFSVATDAIAAGIGMVHQHFMLVENFTVLENVVLGVEGGRLLAVAAGLGADPDPDELRDLLDADNVPPRLGLVALPGLADRDEIAIPGSPTRRSPIGFSATGQPEIRWMDQWSPKSK